MSGGDRWGRMSHSHTNIRFVSFRFINTVKHNTTNSPDYDHHALRPTTLMSTYMIGCRGDVIKFDSISGSRVVGQVYIIVIGRLQIGSWTLVDSDD